MSEQSERCPAVGEYADGSLHCTLAKGHPIAVHPEHGWIRGHLDETANVFFVDGAGMDRMRTPPRGGHALDPFGMSEAYGPVPADATLRIAALQAAATCWASAMGNTDKDSVILLADKFERWLRHP